MGSKVRELGKSRSIRYARALRPGKKIVKFLIGANRYWECFAIRRGETASISEHPIFSFSYGTNLAGYCILAAVDESESQFNAELLKRIGGNDERAFATLYERLAPALYGMAFRIMNDAGEAEEVLQEGFTYIWRRAASFDPSRSSAFAWAVMIVRNKAIDKLRVRQRSERLREKVTYETGFSAASDEQSAHEPALRERRAQVRSALGQIAPDQRQALELAFFSGLTHAQIAEHLEAPLGTVKARIRRGLLKMRDIFHERT